MNDKAPDQGGAASGDGRDGDSAIITAEDSFKHLGEERVQKILARAGFGSRRKCEELILEGRVAVNGEARSQLGCKANVYKDKITVDGERVSAPKPIYYVINKPKGWYCTDDVPDKRILDLVPGGHARLFTVGRLDKSCEGLMLATNDGRVANMLTHPRFNVPKTYKVFLQGHIKFETIAQIERALFHATSEGAFERIKVLKRNPRSSSVRLIVYEGLPSSFRDICTRFGHSISRIVRIKVGPLELGTLGSGLSRRLRQEEVVGLLAYCRDIDEGKIKKNKKRMVTAESIKKAAEMTPEFDKKESGHKGAPSVGQKKRRQEMDQNKRKRSSGSGRHKRR